MGCSLPVAASPAAATASRQVQQQLYSLLYGMLTQTEGSETGLGKPTVDPSIKYYYCAGRRADLQVQLRAQINCKFNRCSVISSSSAVFSVYPPSLCVCCCSRYLGMSTRDHLRFLSLRVSSIDPPRAVHTLRLPDRLGPTGLH